MCLIQSTWLLYTIKLCASRIHAYSIPCNHTFVPVNTITIRLLSRARWKEEDQKIIQCCSWCGGLAQRIQIFFFSFPARFNGGNWFINREKWKFYSNWFRHTSCGKLRGLNFICAISLAAISLISRLWRKLRNWEIQASMTVEQMKLTTQKTIRTQRLCVDICHERTVIAASILDFQLVFVNGIKLTIFFTRW